MTTQDRVEILRLKRMGFDAKHISCVLGLTLGPIKKVLGIQGSDNEKINELLKAGYSVKDITCLTNINPSLIYKHTGIPKPVATRGRVNQIVKARKRKQPEMVIEQKRKKIRMPEPENKIEYGPDPEEKLPRPEQNIIAALPASPIEFLDPKLSYEAKRDKARDWFTPRSPFR